MTHNENSLDAMATTTRLLPWRELKRSIPLSRSTVWRLVRDGKFPAPLRISPGRVAWPENEIEVWRAAQKRSA